MRRASTLAAVLAAASGLLLADVAAAQSGPRTLSWPGRSEAMPADSPAPSAPVPAARDLRRPNPVIPHGGVTAPEPAPRGLTPAPGPARRTLTPANAWLRSPAPPPEPVPAPAPTIAAAPSPNAAPSRPGPEYLPQGGGGQPAPAEAIYPTPAPANDAAVTDPMAPRRDALIFQMQQSPPSQPQAAPQSPPAPRAEAAPQPRPVVEAANSGDGPTRQGGRYYSVHRQNGREPDALTIPEPTYVDGIVASGIETIASQDLAEPDQGPTLIRDRNGNMRAAPAPSDGDHQ